MRCPHPAGRDANDLGIGPRVRKIDHLLSRLGSAAQVLFPFPFLSDSRADHQSVI